MSHHSTVGPPRWSATFPLVGIDDDLFEYACHEGNDSMATGLSGARRRGMPLAARARRHR